MSLHWSLTGNGQCLCNSGLSLFSYTCKCLHFSLLPAPVPLHVVLFSKWSDGLDILVLGVPSLVSHWKRTMSLQLWRCWLYTRKCLHFCLLPALFLIVVLLFKWSDGLDIFSGFLGKGLCPPPVALLQLSGNCHCSRTHVSVSILVCSQPLFLCVWCCFPNGLMDLTSSF